MEMFTAMLMPAKRKLLFPMMDCRALFAVYDTDTQGLTNVGMCMILRERHNILIYKTTTHIIEAHRKGVDKSR